MFMEVISHPLIARRAMHGRFIAPVLKDGRERRVSKSCIYSDNVL